MKVEHYLAIESCENKHTRMQTKMTGFRNAKYSKFHCKEDKERGRKGKERRGKLIKIIEEEEEEKHPDPT